MASFSVVAVNMDNALDKYFNEAPKTVVDVIQHEGAEIIKEKILGIMPISSRNKKHARDNARFSQKNGTTSVTISIGGKYGYVVFPDEGIGAHNTTAQRFMKHGAEDSIPEIVKIIESRVGSL